MTPQENVEQFRKMIRRVLKEEVEKSESGEKTSKRVPEIPEITHGEDLKKITPHQRDTRSKDELLDDMCKLVQGVDKSASCVWDDHDDISISLRDLFRIRIIPKWENNYCIEAFTRNEDRIFITGQNWDQVKEFVKNNLKDATTYTDKAAEKVVKNRKDQPDSPDKGLPQKDKPKLLPTTDEAPKETKTKDKNYTEKQVKKGEDLPYRHMKEVGDIKKQVDHKVSDPVKLRKRKPDTKLVVKQT
jgi:hypothetical protein